MSQLTINDLNHYQSFFSKDAIVGGQNQQVSTDVAVAVKARVTPNSITAGLGFGLAGAIGSNAKTFAGAVVI
ncbi:MAG: hypothetical protein ACK58N_15630 [Synechocystis sp.]|jgi:hypothetical protein